MQDSLMLQISLQETRKLSRVSCRNASAEGQRVEVKVIFTIVSE